MEQFIVLQGYDIFMNIFGDIYGTDECSVSLGGWGQGIVLKNSTFLATVLIYHLNCSKMQSQRHKCSLFHEGLLRKITLVLYLGIPEG